METKVKMKMKAEENMKVEAPGVNDGVEGFEEVDRWVDRDVEIAVSTTIPNTICVRNITRKIDVREMFYEQLSEIRNAQHCGFHVSCSSRDVRFLAIFYDIVVFLVAFGMKISQNQMFKVDLPLDFNCPAHNNFTLKLWAVAPVLQARQISGEASPGFLTRGFYVILMTESGVASSIKFHHSGRKA